MLKTEQRRIESFLGGRLPGSRDQTNVAQNRRQPRIVSRVLGLGEGGEVVNGGLVTVLDLSAGEILVERFVADKEVEMIADNGASCIGYPEITVKGLTIGKFFTHGVRYINH